MHSGRGADEQEHGASDGDATATVTGSAANDGKVVEAALRLPAPLQRRDRERYAIVAEHGRGGLGRVFRAHDQELGRDVAIKELISRSHGAELRFFREALITARLEHPNIVAVHEAGHWPDGTPFYAMKLVAGRPLSAVIEECRDDRGRRALVGRMVAVADAIAYAHERRIIHRDLKPSNIICGEFGETVVIDWGLAKDLTETCEEPRADLPYRVPASMELTVAGSVLGTPAYMAPEQARGEDADERADVYAIGAILREICAAAARDLDPDLRAIIQRACADDRAERYRTARPLARDLHAYVNGRRVSAREYSITAAVAHWARHHVAVSAIAACALAVVVATAGVAFHRVVAARQRAETALEVARRERAGALIAQAGLLLEHDPTRAWEVLDGNGLAAQEPILAARIRTAGVAQWTAAPGGDLLTEVERLDGGRRYVTASSDRVLRVVDAATGQVTVVDQNLTNPSSVAANGQRFAYVRQQDDAFELVAVDSSRDPRVIATVGTMPFGLVLDDERAYWHDGPTLLSVALSGGAVETLATDVRDYMSGAKGVLVCTDRGELRWIGRPDFPATRCGPAGFIRVAGDIAAVPLTATTIGIFENERVTSLPMDFEHDHYEIAASGLVVSYDREGHGLVRAPGSDAFERLSLPSTPTAVATDGNIAVWGFADGTIVAHDVRTRQHWTLRAFPEQILLLDLVGDRLLVDVTNTLRVFRLTADAPVQLATAPAAVLNPVASPDGAALLMDSSDGAVTVLRRDGSLDAIHHHDAMAFGAAWCGPAACTASRDGTVRCTLPDSTTPSVVQKVGAPLRWIESIGDDCVYADAEGDVGLALSGRVLYRQGAESRRVRANPSATTIASSDHAGDVTVWDLETDTMHTKRAHDGRVIDAQWVRDDRLLSAGADGVLVVWSAELESLKRIDLGSAVRLADAGDNTFVASTDDRRIIAVDGDGAEVRSLSVDQPPTIVAVSPGGRLIAAAMPRGDVLVVDVATGATIAHAIGGNLITCLSFRSETELLSCTGDGSVFSVQASVSLEGASQR
jgi:eukaryotic-like serine/threonine-protein kinase